MGASLSLQEASLGFRRTVCYHPGFSIRKLADPRLPFGENSLRGGQELNELRPAKPCKDALDGGEWTGGRVPGRSPSWGAGAREVPPGSS